MDSLYIEFVGRAVKSASGCDAEHVQTAHVHEMSGRESVWKGEVEVFKLDGHSEAQFAYGWGFKDDAGEIRYTAVLGIPPINSPREAVQAAVVATTKRKP